MAKFKDIISQPLVKVSKNIGQVTEEMEKSQKQIEKWKDNSIKAMDKVIKKTAKAGVVMAKTALFDIGFKGMKELDEASAKVKSVAGEVLDLKDIQKDLLQNSTKTGVAVNELADAQYSAILSGVKASESMDAAVQAAKLAKAGFTDSNSALKVMTSTMDVYGLTGTKAMQEISDKLLATQNLGVTSVGELVNSLGSVTPIAKSVGVSLDEVLGAVGSLTKNGKSTSEAMAGLEGIMSNVLKPSRQASDIAQKLGIDFSESAIKSKGFTEWLEEVKLKTKGNTEIMGKLFDDVDGLNAAISLTSGGGFADFKNILDEVTDSAGMTDEAFEAITNTIGSKLNKLKNTFKNIFTSIMSTQSDLIGEYVYKMETWVTNNEEKIQGWIQSIGEGITKMVDFVKSVIDFVKENEKSITTIMVFVGSIYAVFKAISIIIAAMDAWKHISSVLGGALKMSTLTWIVLAIAAVVAAGYALYRNWDLIKEKAFDLWEGIKSAFSSVSDFFSSVWEGIKDGFLLVVDFFSSMWENIKSGFKELINFIIKGINKWIEIQLMPFNLLIKAANKIPGVNIPTVKFEIPTIPAYAKGTSYSSAGYARIHEKGGEIRKLSSGEMIIPADKSDRLLKNKSIGQDIKVEVKILGNVIGNRQFINEVGNEVYRKVSLAYQNV